MKQATSYITAATIIMMLIMGMLPSTTASVVGPFTTSQVSTFTGSDYVDIALDSNGVTHRVFHNGDMVYYSSGDGTDVTPLGGGTNPAIAIDGNDNPHVVFETGGYIVYTMLDRAVPTPDWTTNTVIAQGTTPDLDADDAGNAHITFMNADQYSDVMYMSGNAAGFSTPTMIYDGFYWYENGGRTGRYFSNPAIKIDNAGKYHIAAEHHAVDGAIGWTENHYYIVYTDNVGTGHSTSSPPRGNNVGVGLSNNPLTLDSSGNAYITYTAGLIQLASVVGNTWTEQALFTGSQPSIASNGGNIGIVATLGTNVAYTDITSGYSGVTNLFPNGNNGAIDMDASGKPRVDHIGSDSNIYDSIYNYAIVLPACGNGIVTADEECDDDNIATGDGCNAACDVEAGFECTGEPSVCTALCTTDADCIDSDLCDGAETCVAGDCIAGTPLVCTDSNPTTIDSCTPATGCTYTPLPTPSAVYVDNDYTSESAGGHTFGYDAFNNIQSGIDAVATGGTVTVAEGTYTENLNINKGLTLNGPNTGVAGDAARPTEAELVGYVRLDANAVTIEGFKFTDGANVPAGELTPIHIIGGHSSITIADNNFVRNGVLDFDTSRGIINEMGGISLSTIENNRFSGWHTGLYLQNANSVQVLDNVFEANQVGISDDGANSVTISGNAFNSNAFEGIGLGTSATGFVVTSNNFDGNTLAVSNYVAGYTIMAENNWWGSSTGPQHTSNPTGLGDPVSDGVDFTPWTGALVVDNLSTGTTYVAGNLELSFSNLPVGGGSATISDVACSGAHLFSFAGQCYSIDSDMTNGEFVALLTFHYPDSDNNGIVDGTSIDENVLSAYYNDGTGWVLIPAKAPNTTRDTVANTITVMVNHFTDFSLSSAITVTGHDLTPDYAQNGASLQIIGLLFNNSGPTSDWINNLFITFNGTTTADVPTVEFFYDTNDNGVYDLGTDLRIDGVQTWVAGKAGRTFLNPGPNRLINTGETQWVFVVYNTSAGAASGNAVGGYIAAGELGLASSGNTLSDINAGGSTILDANAPETLGASASPNPTKGNLNVSAATMDEVGVLGGKVCIDDATPGCVGYNLSPSDGTPGGLTELVGTTIDTLSLAEGLHTLYFRAIDMAMRMDMTPWAVLNVMFDHSAPATAINAVPSILTVTTWTFNGTSIDAYTRIMGPGVTYQLDESGWITAAPVDGAWDELTEEYRFTLNGLAEGAHTIYVRASDEPGNVENPPAELDFCVDTVWPIAVIPATYTTDEGTMLVMNASASYDPTANCGDLTYEWFIDGVSVATGGAMFETTWNDNGTHTVTIQVTDAAGHATNASTTVTVLNVAPTVNASDVSGDEGSAVTLHVDFTDPATTNDEPYSWYIDWGDGTTTGPTTEIYDSFEIDHTYADNGTYTISVSVTDKDGGMGSDLATASIANVAPTPTIVSLDDGFEGSPISMTFNFSDPAGVYDQPYRYNVTWGDGTSDAAEGIDYSAGGGITLSHTYADNGVYTVSALVWDHDGMGYVGADDTTIANVAPTVTVLSPNGSEEWNGMRAVNWTFSDPGADTFTCTVSASYFGGGTSIVTSVPCSQGANSVSFNTLTAADNDTYKVFVEVTDDNVGVGSDLSDDFFTIDNTAPVSTLTLGNPNFNNSGTIYVNGTTTFTLSAVDNIVGVLTTIYSIDGGGLVTYHDPLTMTGYSEGTHTLQFYSVDNLGNHELTQAFSFVIDNSVPDADLAIGEPKLIVTESEGDGETTTIYVTNTTGFNVSGVDYPTMNSSVQYCQYGVDDVEGILWVTASEFTLAGVPDGLHTIYYRCVDNLNQTGATESQEVTVDSTAPITTKLISEPRYPDGNTLFSTDFETDNGGFIPSGYWGWGTPTWDSCNSGSKCWGARLDTTYWNYEDDVLLKGTIGPISPGSKLSFAHRMSAESWWDGGYVEVSNDGGSSWTKVTPTEGSGYNNADCSGYVGGGPCFTGSYSWTNSTIDLSAYSGQTIDIRFRFRTDYSVTSYGWLIDDVSVGDGIGGGSNNDVYVNSSTTFTMTAQDAIVGVNATYFRIDGGVWNFYAGPFSLPAIEYAETNHTIEYYSGDLLGNLEAVQNETDYLDNSVPDTTLTLGSPSVYSSGRGITWINSTTDLNLSAVDYPLSPGFPSGVQTIYQILDESSATPYAPPISWALEGPHTLGYYAIDNLDQVESTSTDGFIVDNTPPVIESFYATNPAFSPDGDGVKDNTTFVFTMTDNLATDLDEMHYWITIRDNADSIITSEDNNATSGSEVQMLWDGDAQPDGVYTVELIVQDAIGYNTTQIIEVVIDKVDPVLDSIFIGQTWIRMGTPFYMEAVASDNNGFDGDDCAVTVVDQLDGESFAGYTDVSMTHGRCRGYATLTEELENGFGSISVVLEDAAGNRDSGVYSPLGIDTIVSGPQMTVMLEEHIVTPLTVVPFTISVNPEDMSGFDGFCYVRLGSFGWEQYAMDSEGVCEGDFLVQQVPDSSYVFEAGLKDNVGNWNTTDNTTILVVDGTGPLQHRYAPLAQYYSNSLPINISVTDTPAGVDDTTVVARIYHVGLFGFKVDDVPTTVLTHVPATTEYTATFDISELDEDTQYYFSHKSADLLGNENLTDWNSVPFGIDKTAPVWSIDATLTVTNSPYDKDGNLDLAWPAATDARSGVQHYRIYVNGVLNTTVNATNYSFADLPDGTYEFTVQPVDGAGNVGTSLTRGTTVDRTCTTEGSRCRTSGGGGGGGGGYYRPPTTTPPVTTTSESSGGDESNFKEPVVEETAADEGAPVESGTGDEVPTETGTSDEQPAENDLLTGAVTGGGSDAWMWLWILIGLIAATLLVFVLTRKRK